MKKITSLLFLSLPSLSLADSIDDIRWVSQNYPPYSYQDENGNNTGSVINKLEQIFKKTGSSKTGKDVEMKTFSKMFIKMNNDKNTVFFPLARLPERESMFKWVGPIFMDQPVVFGRSSINIANVNDLKNYLIGGREGYPGVKQLDSMDISEFKFSDKDAQNMMSLRNSQVGLVVCDEMVGNYIMQNLGMKPADYKVVYRLQPVEMAFAFNKDTDDAIVQEVANAIK